MRKPKTIYFSRGTIVTGPVLTDDAIFAAVRDGMTIRLDRRTLREDWWIDSDDWGIGRAVDNSLLTVGGPAGAGVRSADDGRLLWSAPSRFSGAGVWNSHLVLDSEGIELRDARTGAPTRAYPAARDYTSKPCCLGSLQILQSNRIVKAFNLTSASIEWERPLVDEMQARVSRQTESAAFAMVPGSLPDRLIVFHEGGTFAVSVADGSILWHRAGVWSPYASPTVLTGRIYTLSLNRFRALDEATGATVYDVTIPELEDLAFREKTGVAYEDRIAFAHESGLLAIFDMADGRLASLYRGKAGLWRGVEADGRLIVGTSEGSLMIFDESVWALDS